MKRWHLPRASTRSSYRRSKERECCVFGPSSSKGTFSRRGKAQRGFGVFWCGCGKCWNPRTPSFEASIPTDMFPMVWDIVQMHKRQILQAELDYTFIWIVISQTKSAPCQVQGH